MTDVTVGTRKEITGNLGVEVLNCTFTDGNTFTSRFGTIVAVMIQSRSRDGAYASVSGRTVTLNCASASGDTGDIIIYGY